MYKYLVVGLTVIIILGAGFYVRSSGGAKLIGDAYAQDSSITLNPTSIEAIPGVYSCDQTTGCLSTSTLVLKDDNTLDMITTATSSGYIVVEKSQEEQSQMQQNNTTASTESNEAGNGDASVQESQPDESVTSSITEASTLLEKGTWDIGNNNILIIALTGSATTTYDTAKKIIIQHVGTTTLSRFSFNRIQYPTFKRPTFLKQQY